MKKAVLAILLTACLLTACQKQAAVPETQPKPTQPEAVDIALYQQERDCSFAAQYIRTDGYHDEIRYPVVRVIRSVEALNTYYEENKALYYLESPEFADARDQYDSSYFADRFLLMVLLQEGSGSVTHQVTKLRTADTGNLTVDISSELPGGIGTSDMALWHILIEPEAGIPVPAEDQIQVYLNERLAYDGHYHLLAQEPEIVENPVNGYCGNTVTIVSINGKEYSFWGSDSVTLTDMLLNLEYAPHRVCKCLPEYKIVTEFGSYGVHLSQGYARCEAGQAPLTWEQIMTIRTILDQLQNQEAEAIP